MKLNIVTRTKCVKLSMCLALSLSAASFAQNKEPTKKGESPKIVKKTRFTGEEKTIEFSVSQCSTPTFPVVPPTYVEVVSNFRYVACREYSVEEFTQVGSGWNSSLVPTGTPAEIYYKLVEVTDGDKQVVIGAIDNTKTSAVDYYQFMQLAQQVQKVCNLKRQLAQRAMAPSLESTKCAGQSIGK